MITLNNVTKIYDKQEVIKKVSLEIADGDFIVFLGASGCGKTTTLKMINKLTSITSGKIEVDGIDVEKIDTTKLRRKIGYVIQNIGLFPHMTILENITIILKLQKVPQEQCYQKALELINLVGMSESYLNRYPDEMSGGQQQRVGVARALANDPSIILMDEPFSGLDPITRTQLQDEIVELQKRLKKTILFVTHDIDEALRIADKICIFEKGEVSQFDTPQQILNNPANQYIIDFIGENKLWQNPSFIPVKEIMIPAITITEKATMLNASQKMRSSKVDTLVVVDKEKHYLGMLGMEKLLLVSTNPESIVKNHLNNVLYTLAPDTMVDEAISLMIDYQQKLIPVVDKENKLFGIITRSNLFNAIGTQFIHNGADVMEEGAK